MQGADATHSSSSKALVPLMSWTTPPKCSAPRPDDVDGLQPTERYAQKNDVGLIPIERRDGRLRRMKTLRLHAPSLQCRREVPADAFLVVDDERVGRYGILWG